MRTSSPFLRALAYSVSAALSTVLIFILVSALDALVQGRDLGLFGALWNPAGGKFGILTMIWNSALLAVSSLTLGWLLSLGCACLLNGLAPAPAARFLTGLLSLMTAVPTVIYGFAAVFLLVPVIRNALGGTGFSWLAATLLLALQGVPTMTFVMDGALRTVVRESALTAAALGMTRAEHLSRIALPLSSRALTAAAVLGFGRALGDALLPTMLAGNSIAFALSPLDSMRTLTAHIALVLSSDIGGGEHLSLLLAGGILMTLCAAASLATRRIAGGRP